MSYKFALLLGVAVLFSGNGMGDALGNSVHFTPLQCPVDFHCPHPNRCYAPDGLENPVVCGATVPIIHFPPDCTQFWPILALSTFMAFGVGLTIAFLIRRQCRRREVRLAPRPESRWRQSFRNMRHYLGRGREEEIGGIAMGRRLGRQIGEEGRGVEEIRV